MSFRIILVLLCLLFPTQSSAQVVNQKNSKAQITIQSKTCAVIGTNHSYWSLGSVSVDMFQLDENVCSFEIKKEIEMEISTYQCHVPQNQGNLTIYENSQLDSNDQMGYRSDIQFSFGPELCELISQKNLRFINEK